MSALLVVLVLFALLFQAFYLARSSKEMPKTWAQFRSELFWEYMGVRGLIEDFILEAIEHNELEGTNISYEFLDTGNLKSVRQFAATVRTKCKKIDVLINNAGVMATPYHLAEDGFESQFAINYLGHFLLTHLLLPEIKAAGIQDLYALRWVI